jgi:hypothetical protein
MENEKIIAETKQWVKEVVIGLNFCPFALKEFNKNTIRYVVDESSTQKPCIDAVLNECTALDNDETIETTLLILPNGFESFTTFLNLVDKVEHHLFKNNYDGIYQLAHFHPDYLFADSDENDAANYTNRSIYPMLHILRESSLDKILNEFANPDAIPDKNIELARTKGLEFMQQLRLSCLKNTKP